MAVEVRAREADIPMGMTQIEEGEAKVLVIRDATGLRAFQATCPHYGAPLAKGKICGRALYCPWHKAAFDIGDGALLEPPALDALAQYPIRKDGERIVVTLEPMARARPATSADERTFVVVGTGAAAVAAVTTLREEGFGGKIVMIGREDAPPYDRPALSKTFLAKPTDPASTFLEDDFYAAHRVEAVHGTATRIEPAHRSVTLEDGTTVTGDALLIATGSTAKAPPFPGGDLDKVFVLRTLADAARLADAAQPGRRIAVIGGGFIGLEAAAFLTKRGLAATVVSPEALPMAARFGDDVAHAVRVHHQGAGVQFRQGQVARLDGEGDVARVRLEGGETIDADLVLVAVGAQPETAAIVAPKRPDHGIQVDATMRLADGVWLAGDIAAFPLAPSGTLARIEHWRLAEQHGRHVARAMLGASAPFAGAPFFWSNQGAKRLDYAGYAPEWDEIAVRGDVAALDFIAYYIRDGRALAACAIGQNEQMIAFLHLLGEDRLPPGEEIATTDLAALV